MRRTFLLGMAAMAACSATDKYTPVEWEHGWKTYRVIATRYKNEMMGYNIGLTFPLDPSKCDRGEIVRFLESRQGHIYTMGGFPGAPIYLTFDSVKDRETASIKLKSILPDLTRLMESLR